jgi:hypothetical protein
MKLFPAIDPSGIRKLVALIADEMLAERSQIHSQYLCATGAGYDDWRYKIDAYPGVEYTWVRRTHCRC